MILNVCAYCGSKRVEAHKKYTDRCIECGKMYCRYTTYKSLQRKAFSFSRENALEEIRCEYLMRAKAGFKVPKDISKEVSR